MGQRLVYGVGINDAGYKVQKKETIGYVGGKRKQGLVWICPFYQVWINMLKRGYSFEYKTIHPTYENAYVCNEWLLFSNFKTWMEQQDWKGKQLDKDLLVQGNKVYSPDVCVFVSNVINKFVLDSAATRGQYMIGCYWNKQRSKFMARCNNPFTKKSDYLGYHDSELEAHKAWLERKRELAYELAATQTDERIVKALISRYEDHNTLKVINRRNRDDN